MADDSSNEDFICTHTIIAIILYEPGLEALNLSGEESIYSTCPGGAW